MLTYKGLKRTKLESLILKMFHDHLVEERPTHEFVHAWSQSGLDMTPMYVMHMYWVASAAKKDLITFYDRYTSLCAFCE
jgi:hypothetical protein